MVYVLALALAGACGSEAEGPSVEGERQPPQRALTTMAPRAAGEMASRVEIEYGEGAKVVEGPSIVASGRSSGLDWQLEAYRVRTPETTIECLELRAGDVAGSCADVDEIGGLNLNSTRGMGAVAHGRAPPDAVEVQVELASGRRMLSDTVPLAGAASGRYYVIRLAGDERAVKAVAFSEDGEVLDTVGGR